MDSLEVLVWVFFVVAVVVFNLIQQWQRQARRRLEEKQAQAGAGATRTGAPAAPAPRAGPGRKPPPPTPFGAEPWGRAPDRSALEEEWLETRARPLPPEVPAQLPVPVPVPVPVRAKPAPAVRVVPGARVPRQRPFRTAREVRQGIVAMTVLGPCRALDPYDPPQAEPPRT
jgi:hypothetical protein